MPARRTDASFPDAAKPQHFRLEVEARFRQLSRSTDDFQWRSSGTLRERLRRLSRCWLIDLTSKLANDRARRQYCADIS